MVDYRKVNGVYFLDAVQPYAQRADKIRLTAGDAQEVNTRIHEVDPWPRNVGDKRIYSNGQRMADAVWRYRCGKEPQPPMTSEESHIGQRSK